MASSKGTLTRRCSWPALVCVLLVMSCFACAADQATRESSRGEAGLAYEAFFRSAQFNEWFKGLADIAGKPTFVLEAAPVITALDGPPPRDWVPAELWIKMSWPASSAEPGATAAAARAMGWPLLTSSDELRLFQSTPPAFDRYAAWQPGWAEFGREHPGAVGVLGVSPLITSPDSKQALLYAQLITEHNHGQCGLGGIALLTRGHEGWQVQNYERTWVGY